MSSNKAEDDAEGAGTLDEFWEEMETRWKQTPPIVRFWWVLTRRWDAGWRGVRYTREFFIRGRWGWAPSDTWSLDHYLAGVIGHSLVYLADHNHGWPGTDEWKTPEEWEAELRKQAAVLIDYSADHDSRKPEEVSKAVRRLADYWGHLWD